MSLRRAPTFNMLEPSTSTAPPLRIQENLRLFESFCSPSPVTLWQICSPKLKKLPLKHKYHSELQALRGISFSSLLMKYKIVLDDLAAISCTTFEELCRNLKFFAYYRADPYFESNNRGAKDLFRHICNCICYSNNAWIADLNKNNILEPASMEILKSKRRGETERRFYEFERKYFEEQKKKKKLVYQCLKVLRLLTKPPVWSPLLLL
uniref:Ras-GEF domain-containing protein n=1 Tax=Caenorhabditis tropicalis TaxID=1561998 RepID=A0A1I7T3W2_9PELO